LLGVDGRCSAHSDCCFFALFTKLLTYLLTYFCCRSVGLLLCFVSSVTLGSPGVARPLEAPVFVVQPDDVYYVAKGRPVTFTCRAAPAIQISVKCGGQWISPTRQVRAGHRTVANTHRSRRVGSPDPPTGWIVADRVWSGPLSRMSS